MFTYSLDGELPKLRINWRPNSDSNHDQRSSQQTNQHGKRQIQEKLKEIKNQHKYLNLLINETDTRSLVESMKIEKGVKELKEEIFKLNKKTVILT